MNQEQEIFFALDSAEHLLGRGGCSLVKGAIERKGCLRWEVSIAPYTSRWAVPVPN